MILNDAKVIFTVTGNSGFSIITDNLDEQHKKDIENSYHTYHNDYFKHYKETEEYYNITGLLYPIHFYRQFFDQCFLGNREDFFYTTIVRNPWSHSLSTARLLIKRYNLNIPFTLDYKQEINNVISKIYNHKLYYTSLLKQHCDQLMNANQDFLDYDYILYFEDIHNDLNALSKLSGLKFNKNINIKHQPIDYREYLTEENIELITKMRKADRMIFGYDFDKGLLFKNSQPKINNKLKLKIS